MFRLMRKADEADFLRMAEDFYRSPAVIGNVSPENFKRTFAEIIKGSSPYLEGYIFEWEGNIAGYAILGWTFSPELGGHEVIIEELYILEPYQSKGLGREFFDFLHDRHADNIKRYRMEVEESNLRALKIYRHYGYQELAYIQMYRDMD